MIRWKYVMDNDGYITGWEGANVADDVGPGEFPPPPDDLLSHPIRDAYGNPMFQLVQTNDADGPGRYKIVKSPQTPTEEQVSQYLAKERKSRVLSVLGDPNDEFALLHKAVEAIASGLPLPKEYVEFREKIAFAKAQKTGLLGG